MSHALCAVDANLTIVLVSDETNHHHVQCFNATGHEETVMFLFYGEEHYMALLPSETGNALPSSEEFVALAIRCGLRVSRERLGPDGPEIDMDGFDADEPARPSAGHAATDDGSAGEDTKEAALQQAADDTDEKSLTSTARTRTRKKRKIETSSKAQGKGTPLSRGYIPTITSVHGTAQDGPYVDEKEVTSVYDIPKNIAGKAELKEKGVDNGGDDGDYKLRA